MKNDISVESNRYLVPGVFSIIYGVWTFIAFFISLFLSDANVTPLDIFIMIIEFAFFAYIIFSLKDYLNNFVNFTAADTFLIIYFITNVIVGIILLFFTALIPGIEKLPKKEELIASSVTFLMIFLAILLYGVITLLLGLKLMKVLNYAKGLIRIFGITQVIAGICAITCLGIYISVIVDGIGYIILGIAFINIRGHDLKYQSNSQSLDSNKNNLKNEIKSELIREIKSELLNQKIVAVKNDNISSDEKINKIFNSLSLDEYNKIKIEAIKYLPKGLSEEEIQRLIKEYIKEKHL